MAERHRKLCMDPGGLVRKGKFGEIALFDSALEEQLGPMDVIPLRGLYAEHCRMPDSNKEFSPPNNPDLVCTPKGELFFVVGEDGIDIVKWELKAGAQPTCGAGSMVEGRNAKTMAQVLEAKEAKAAGLLPAELIALRTYSGPMYAKYNQIMRDTLAVEASGVQVSQQDGHGQVNMYPTTIQLIVSGIRKLSRIAEMPEGGAVYRGLSGLALPPELFALDEQGFAGGVEAAFMSTTVKEEVARKYSGVHEGREATIFKLLLGKTSLGANIAWISQFEGEEEMVYPPRTQLQIDGEPVMGADGVSVVTLRPTVFQNVSTVEEVLSSRKEGLKQLASSRTWDIRNQAAREGKLDASLAQRLDALTGLLVTAHCSQEPEWYNDNMKYKSGFKELFDAARTAETQIHDPASLLCKRLDARIAGGDDKVSAAAAPTTSMTNGESCSASTNEVSSLHSKFCQDPHFKGIRGKFGSDELFASGIDGVVGPMDAQYVRAMFNEHNLATNAEAEFTAWNAGHVIKTNAKREWLFVVGAQGVNQDSWTLDPALSEPEVAEGMMVDGRNAKRLAQVLDTPEVKKAGLSAAEAVAIRLYTGPLYVLYNAVLRGLVAPGDNLFPATIHLICSGVRKLSRVTKVPEGLTVYRGNGGMALPPSFLEKDAQGFAGGVECALMSTTPNRSVALGYSGLAKGKELPTLFEITVGKTSIGANIGALSQFEAEEEYLYAPLTHMQLLGTPRLERDADGRELSVLQMQLTANQKTKTVEQAERLRLGFLEQLVSTLVWDVRHWASRQQVSASLSAKMDAMQADLRVTLGAATVQSLNDNAGFVDVFERVMDLSEARRVEVAEALCEHSQAAHSAGQMEDAGALLEKAIDARGPALCADLKAGRDRVIDMRRALVALRVDGDKAQAARDKMKLASDLDDRGEYEEALVLYEEAVAGLIEVHGHDHLDVAKSYMNMANVYNSQRKYDEALEYHQKSLSIKLTTHGDMHPDVAKSCNNMANVYKSQGKYEQALEYHQKSLSISLTTHGDMHPDVASSKENIGLLFKATNKKEEAKNLFLEAAAIRRKMLGPAHHLTQRSERLASAASQEVLQGPKLADGRFFFRPPSPQTVIAAERRKEQRGGR